MYCLKLGEDYKENIQDDSRYYLETSIAKKPAEMGFAEVGDRYRDVYAIVPLKHPVGGMKVRIDGRAFVNYAQFESGIVVPNSNRTDTWESGMKLRDSTIHLRKT